MRTIQYPLLFILAMLCAACTSNPVPLATDTVSRLDSLNTGYERRSNKSFAVTVADLQSAIDAKGLRVFALIDHQKGAASVNLQLSPAVTLIFGNPMGGTPLMQSDPAIAVDLPLKAAVVQRDQNVYVVMQNLDRFGQDYALDSQAERLGKIRGLMKGLLKSAVE